MKKGILLAVAAALMIAPAAAMAKRGPHGHGGRKVVYVLHGTLSAYTPYNNSIYGPTDGSITIAVRHANRHSRALKSMTLTFAVGPHTRIWLRHGVSTITDGDRGIVTVRAAKRIHRAHLATTLQGATARQIVDQGPSH